MAPNSYHPNQRGHDAIAEEVAALFGKEVRFDDVPRETRVDYANATIPVRCDEAAGTAFTLQLSGGRGRREDPGRSFDVEVVSSADGDVDGDGRSDTALLVRCVPQPSNFSVQEITVLDADGRLLAHLPEQLGLASPDAFDAATLAVHDGRLSVDAQVRAEGQCRACGDPAVHRRFEWRWDGVRLVPSER